MSLQQWFEGFAGASPIEWIATVAGFLCVFLLIQRSRWNFLFGFVQVTLYVWIFWHAKLYSETALHVFYMFFQVYGWWIWSHSGRIESGKIVVVVGDRREHLLILLLITIGTIVLGTALAGLTDAALPYPDAFVTCTSIVAQFLLSHKRLVNWILWIVVDIVAILMYVSKGLYPTSVLYMCFLVMSAMGLRQWYFAWNESRKSAGAYQTEGA